MAASPNQRAGLMERTAYTRRMVLATILSGLVHLLLWNGLTTTRLSLLGSKPQDATARKPALKPKLAVDFPLQVPKASVSAQAAHERPLDMQVVPRDPQDVPRPLPDRDQPAPRPSPEPEQPLPVAVAPPTVERSASPRDIVREKIAAETAAALQRQRLAGATAPDGAVARVAAAPGTGISAPADAPKPTALPPRPSVPEPATVARPGPREIAMAPALPAASPLPSRLSAADRDETAAPQLQAIAPASRRAVAASGATENADAAPQPAAPVSVPAGNVGAAAAAAGPRPQSSTAPLTRIRPLNDRGKWAATGGPTTADIAAQAGAAIADTTPAVPGLTAARPGTARALAEGAAGAAPPAALSRSSPAGTVGPDAMAATDAKATAVALPTGGGAGAGTEPGGTASGVPMPTAMAGRGDRTSAATRRLAAATTNGAGIEADDEELSSVAERGAAAGAGDVAGALAGRDRGQDAAVELAPQPLGRVAAVTLPVEGRVREIAIPFARRSRANRDARIRERPEGELVIREKTRVVADAMVDRGLDFLARAQQPDGRWQLGAFPGATAADAPKLSCDTAATGLAILSFLGAGHDHFGGRHRDTVRRGLEFLLSVQKPDGDLFLPADPLSNSCAWLYSHGIASMALCEAVGMTGDAVVKPAAAKACDFIAASQHPTRGGWRYTPRSDADLSVSGWMLVALRSGKLAGVEVEPQTFAGVRTLLEASAVADAPARYHYNARNPQQRPSSLSAGCMTAVGALMRLHTGSMASDPRVRESARALAALRPTYGTGRDKTRDCYLWYYASQVLVHTGGEEWTDWYDELAATLERTQERDGPRAGSWDPLGAIPDRWGPYGGRIYVTALHLLALEVPDRRLPTYGSPDDATGR